MNLDRCLVAFSSHRYFREAAFVLALLVPPGYIAFISSDMPQLGTFGDDQAYLVLAQALAERGEYRIASLPDEPFETKFPVLYPLILSSLWRIRPDFPANLPLLVAFSFVTVACFLLLSRMIFRHLGFTEPTTSVLSVLLALNPQVTGMAAVLNPEMLFSVLLFGAVLLMERARGLRIAFAAGILGGLAYLSKTAALPLLLTGPLFFLLRKRRTAAVAFLIGMAPFVFTWNLWVRFRLVKSTDVTTIFYTDYKEVLLMNMSLRDAPRILWANILSAFDCIGVVLTAFPVEPIADVAAFCSIIGVILLIKRFGLGALHLFVVAYCVLLIVWPYKPVPRYIIPLLPLFLGSLACTARKVIRLTGVPNRVFVSLSLAVLLCLFAGGLSLQLNQLRQRGADVIDERKAYFWIRNNLPQNAQFISGHDGLIYVYTRRHATSYQFRSRDFYRNDRVALSTWIRRLPDFAKQNKAEYFFASSEGAIPQLPARETSEAVQVVREYYRELFRCGAVRIYKLRSPRGETDARRDRVPNLS